MGIYPAMRDSDGSFETFLYEDFPTHTSCSPGTDRRPTEPTRKNIERRPLNVDFSSCYWTFSCDKTQHPIGVAGPQAVKARRRRTRPTRRAAERGRPRRVAIAAACSLLPLRLSAATLAQHAPCSLAASLPSLAFRLRHQLEGAHCTCSALYISPSLCT